MSSFDYTVALAGNPNVGKSTIFNSLTGMHQHTGNWTGKTVENAAGEYLYNEKRCMILDLPGTYSLTPSSAEEEAACGYILSGEYDVLVIVLDSVCIKRNLRFACEVISKVKKPVVVCLNLIDEARKKGIFIDCERLSEQLGIPVIPAAARSGEGLEELKSAVERNITLCNSNFNVKDVDKFAEELYKICCFGLENSDSHDRFIDKILLSKSLGIPIMLILLFGVFWITVVGANYPSQWLSMIFAKFGIFIGNILENINCPNQIISAIVDGVYSTLTWVVAVMLPPMAIFFPLFTLLEDSGYLPRIAFNLDTCFKCVGAHGKQSLTTAMAFGCNACAVSGCRIIDSPRERLIAVITNSLIPCNGRFPLIISLVTVFFCSFTGGLSSALRALIILAFIVLSFAVSLLASKILSVTVLKGVPSSFVLELPPYRRPQIGKVIIRSIFDRTLFVLLRAVSVAAPAGLIIWLLANVTVNNVSLMSCFTDFLNPFAVLIGLDGAILASFILGFPANEIVLPICTMIYMSQQTLSEIPGNEALYSVLTAHGWTWTTAVCVIIFSMFHFPCSTTVLTIYKETGKLRWTLLSIAVPLIIGIIMCASINLIVG